MTLQPLKPGDRLRFVAPSSPFAREPFDRAVRLLEAGGYEVSFGDHLFSRHGYLAGTEADRAEDLINAFTDPDIRAVICARGGYGSGRLLPWLPFSTLRKHHKFFIGHSDITFLHLAFASQMGWTTFLGPNLTGMGEFPEHADIVLKTLRGESDFTWTFEDARVLKHGTASGNILGGNLTCIAHLLGTPYFPDLSGTLLLIEDRGEALYRLDRMLTQLRLSGSLSHLSALLLGRFEDCGDPAAIHAMIADQVRTMGFPVVAGLPFGHGPVHEVIPFGIPFSLNTYDRCLKPVKSPFNG